MGRGESGDKGTGCGRAGYAVIPCSRPPELFVLIFSWIDVQFCFFFQAVHFDLRSIVIQGWSWASFRITAKMPFGIGCPEMHPQMSIWENMFRQTNEVRVSGGGLC